MGAKLFLARFFLRIDSFDLFFVDISLAHTIIEGVETKQSRIVSSKLISIVYCTFPAARTSQTVPTIAVFA